MNDSIISPKLCECGCGRPAPIAARSKPSIGHIKGQPVRFIVGHAATSRVPAYIVDEDTGCWNWNRYKTGLGYGVTSVNRKPRAAHRVYWERENGPVPEGLELDHLCRNPSCVNPAHLEAVTRAVNLQRGLKAKLNPAKVKEIRSRQDDSIDSLASEFGVSKSTICKVRLGRTWRNI